MNKPIDEIKKMQLIAGLINEVEYNESLWGISKQSLNESETKEAKKDEAVKAEVKAKAPSTKKPTSLHIDQANPYEYRHGIAHELNELGEYTDEALEKAKTTVLKNLAKDANFYSNLLNQQQSSFEFKPTETDKPGMQARPDGHMKKEAKKDEKSNVKDNLGKKEAGKTKPKGVKVMPDKGVEGKEKTIKEGVDDKVEDMIKSGKIKPEEVKSAAEKAMKGDSTSLVALMAGLKLAEGVDPDGYKVHLDDLINICNRLGLKNTVDYFSSMKNDPEVVDGWIDMNTVENHFIPYSTGKITQADYDLWRKVISNVRTKDAEENEFGEIGSMEEGSFMGGVDLGASFEKMKGGMADENAFNDLMKKYDWYAEMSDDSRKWDAQQDTERQIKMLAKKIGANKATEIWNSYAPEDRKVQSSFFMSEDKISKIKEALKKALKEKMYEKENDIFFTSNAAEDSALKSRVPGVREIPGTSGISKTTKGRR